MIVIRVAYDLLDTPQRGWGRWDWIALLTAFAALAVHLWDPKATFPLRGFYVLGLSVVGMFLVLRELTPSRYFVWTGICELTGFILIAALVGWVLFRFPNLVERLRIPNGADRWRGVWFRFSQAFLASVCVPLIMWIALDPQFDGMGEGHALLGLAGRLASCPAALILLGGCIVMAWQTTGRWRAGWQFASLAAGVLFTSVVGWARLEGTADSPWVHRCLNLLISFAMMTLLTRFGLARVLPHSGDWISRARQAAPVFGGLALLMIVLVLIQWAF